jgi:tight adherence protein B
LIARYSILTALSNKRTKVVNNPQLVFLIMVSIAVFLLMQSLMIRSLDKRVAKRIRRRMHAVAELYKDTISASLLKEKYRSELTPLGRLLELLPGLPALQRLIEQSGRNLPVQHFILLSLGLMALVATSTWLYSHSALNAMLAGLLAGSLPFIKINIERNRRMATFEEQLPDAIDVMVRALRAGYPFNETLHVVAEEMDDPARKEFGTAFFDINYGTDIKLAFLNLLERVPSMNLLSLVTAVLIQRETGGNLTEILEKISAVIRGRFRFQRRVRSLSAEGRLSAWILTLLPFVLAAVLTIMQPGYLPMLTKDPAGFKLIGIAFTLAILGIFWMQRIIRKVMEI